MTIRRDLRRLERDGFVRRTYGGATTHLVRTFEVGANARTLRHAKEKRLIAKRAADLTVGVRSMFLGIGTTVEHFARLLPAREDLMVITPSLAVASLLGTRNVRVIIAGGPGPPGRADLHRRKRRRGGPPLQHGHRRDRRSRPLGATRGHRARRPRRRCDPWRPRADRTDHRDRRRLEVRCGGNEHRGPARAGLHDRDRRERGPGGDRAHRAGGVEVVVADCGEQCLLRRGERREDGSPTIRGPV